VLSQDADIGKLKDLPPEAVDELKKGARNLSDALFSETPPDGE
jgi:hypothetical protein